MNITKPNKQNKIIFNMIFLGILSIYIISYKYKIFDFNNESILYINSLIGWFFIFWLLYSIKKITGSFLSLYTSFVLIMIIFTFGQSLIYPFNLISESYNLYSNADTNIFIEAQFFTLLSYFILHLGALIVHPMHNNKINCNLKNNNKTMQNAMYITGIILLIISLPAFIVNLYNTLIVVINYGYGALFGYDGNIYINQSLVTRIILTTESFFIPSLLLIYISSKNKQLKFMVVTLNILYIIIRLYIGGRGSAALLLITLFLLFLYSSEKKKKSKIILYFLIAYILISFMSVVANFRSLNNRSFINYLEAFFSSFGKKHLFFDLISELGVIMLPLINVMKIVPTSSRYNLGKSYIYGLFSIFPNLGFWDIHPSKIYASGDSWLMDVLNLNYGPGFSIQAEAYWNFGWYGLIIFLFIGMILGRIFGKINKNTFRYKPLLFALTLILFNEITLVVRGDILRVVRPLFYIVLPIYLTVIITYESMLYKNNNKFYNFND